jgi:hypothetical protein
LPEGIEVQGREAAAVGCRSLEQAPMRALAGQSLRRQDETGEAGERVCVEFPREPARQWEPPRAPAPAKSSCVFEKEAPRSERSLG